MNQKLKDWALLVTIIVFFDILDGDFDDPSVFDIIKWILVIVSYIIIFKRSRLEEKE